MAKFVNVQIPLVELSSDSEGGSSAPPPPAAPASPPAPVPASPAASRTRSDPRTPRFHPTVSDDASSDSPARVPTLPRRSRTPSDFRVPAPRPHPPRVPAPAPPVVHPRPFAPRVHYQAHTSVRPLLPHQLAPRGLPGPFPHSVYEHGESSRQPTYDRRVDMLAAETQDARYSYHRLRETQESMQRHLAAFESVMARWRHAVDVQAHAMTARAQRMQLEYLQRTARLERVVTGVIALGLAAVAAIVAFMPWFYPRG